MLDIQSERCIALIVASEAVVEEVLLYMEILKYKYNYLTALLFPVCKDFIIIGVSV